MESKDIPDGAGINGEDVKNPDISTASVVLEVNDSDIKKDKKAIKKEIQEIKKVVDKYICFLSADHSKEGRWQYKVCPSEKPKHWVARLSCHNYYHTRIRGQRQHLKRAQVEKSELAGYKELHAMVEEEVSLHRRLNLMKCTYQHPNIDTHSSLVLTRAQQKENASCLVRNGWHGSDWLTTRSRLFSRETMS
jgi:hypothetical protein